MKIIFGMPEKEYHAIPAVSYSGIKALIKSPLDFWVDSWMNPFKEEQEETPAKIKGSAYHKRVLEGREAFEAEYGVKPLRDDYPEAMVTTEDMKEWLNARGLKQSGKKSELIERVLQQDPDAFIWDRFVEERLEGRTILSQKVVDEIEFAAQCIEQQPSIEKAFKGGMPEVVLLWSEEDTPMKARLDYLKRNAVVDLKTFSNSQGKRVEEAVSYSVANYRYHWQFFVYLRGLETIKQGLKNGTVEVVGDIDPEFIKGVTQTDKHRFFIVFQQADGVPNVLSREMTQFDTLGGMGATANEYWRTAKQAFEEGLKIYRRNLSHFGEEMWLQQAHTKAFVDTDFPVWMYDHV